MTRWPVLFVALLLVACGRTSAEKRLVGTWSRQSSTSISPTGDNTSTIELRPDMTFTRNIWGSVRNGTWELRHGYLVLKKEGSGSLTVLAVSDDFQYLDSISSRDRETAESFQRQTK